MTYIWRKINVDYKLLKNRENIKKENITLFCLPFAGGGASAYSTWIKKLSDGITVCPIQLPGREERIMEKPYTDMKLMLEDLMEEIESAIQWRYSLWGHSMGGKIVYELEKHLENKGYQAQYLFVSGSRIPSIPEPNPIYHLPDEAFKRELQRFEGTPKEIMENQELLKIFLPMLRADFTMDETYYTERQEKIHAPIIAFAGMEDKEATPSDIKKWENYTDQYFQYFLFKGGHFYIREKEIEVIDKLNAILKGITDEI